MYLSIGRRHTVANIAPGQSNLGAGRRNSCTDAPNNKAISYSYIRKWWCKWLERSLLASTLRSVDVTALQAQLQNPQIHRSFSQASSSKLDKLPVSLEDNKEYIKNLDANNTNLQPPTTDRCCGISIHSIAEEAEETKDLLPAQVSSNMETPDENVDEDMCEKRSGNKNRCKLSVVLPTRSISQPEYYEPAMPSPDIT